MRLSVEIAMLRLSMCVLFVGAIAPAHLVASVQNPPAVVPAAPAAAAEEDAAVTVPTFPNSTCPIMGKKVSMKLFTDTPLGRIYICCKGCDKKIQRDVPTAYKSAYPTLKEIANTTCPVSGDKIGDKAVDVTLQGHKFKVCCADCVPHTVTNAQIVLALVTDAKLTDLRNAQCPLTDKAVADNAFAIVGTTVVRLSSPQCVDDLRRAAVAMRDKAKASAAASALPDPRAAKPASAPAAGDASPSQTKVKDNAKQGDGK
jgi:hypothetical protein